MHTGESMQSTRQGRLDRARIPERGEQDVERWRIGSTSCRDPVWSITRALLGRQRTDEFILTRVQDKWPLGDPAACREDRTCVYLPVYRWRKRRQRHVRSSMQIRLWMGQLSPAGSAGSLTYIRAAEIRPAWPLDAVMAATNVAVAMRSV